jgi:hypothetical protein
MPPAASDQSIQVELKFLIVLLVDNSGGFFSARRDSVEE